MEDEKTKKIDEMNADVWGEVDGKDYSVKVILDSSVLNTITLKDGDNLIGRMPENDIMVDDPEVSRSHAKIIFSKGDGTLLIEDMQSENGIFVNGNKIKNKAIKVGDTIRVGSHELKIEFSTDYSKKTELAEQIKKAESQEWRLDQTMAAPTPELQKELLKQMEEKKANEKNVYGTMQVEDENEQAKIRDRILKQDTKKTRNKELSVSFDFAGKKYVENLKFDFVRDVDPKREKNLDDAIYVNVKIGNIIMGKKIKI